MRLHASNTCVFLMYLMYSHCICCVSECIRSVSWSAFRIHCIQCVFRMYFKCIQYVFEQPKWIHCIRCVFSLYFMVSRPYSEIQCILNVFRMYPHVFFCILVSDKRIHSSMTYFGVSARIFFDEKKYVKNTYKYKKIRKNTCIDRKPPHF